MKVDQPWGGTFIDLSPAAIDSYYRGSCVILKLPVLKLAVPVDERTQPDIDHNAMCGAAWLSWALACVGINVSAEDLEQWMRATYGEAAVHSGVVAVQLASAAQHFGCPADVSTAMPSTLLGVHVVGVCVWCTPYAVPCTKAQSQAAAPPYGLGHWIGPVAPIQEDAMTGPQARADACAHLYSFYAAAKHVAPDPAGLAANIDALAPLLAAGDENGVRTFFGNLESITQIKNTLQKDFARDNP